MVYRRSTGELLACEDCGADLDGVALRRSATEMERKDDPDVEVVVLSARSREALMRTHSRYFKGVRELTADLVAALPGA